MFNGKEFIGDSLEKAAESTFRASLYVDFLEDIFTSLELYPNVNEYLDYGLNCDVRDTIYELQRKVESFKTKTRSRL